MLLSQIKCLNLLRHEYLHGDICVTHYCVIDHALLQAMRQTVTQYRLFQLINVMNFRLVEPLLHFSPNSVVNRFQIWTLGIHRSNNNNKCIGDDTKAAARQSLNCIKNKII